MPTANLQVPPPRRAPAQPSRKRVFQRAIPASIDFGAVHGRHLHFCLCFYPDHGLGLSFSMGHTANRLASARSLVRDLCADVCHATLALRSAECPGFHRAFPVSFDRIWSFACSFLDRRLLGYTIFRNIFLFPYALSFIVTGIAWRWIFNPETGINLLFDGLGINKWLVSIGAPPFRPGWTTDPSVLLSVNDALGHVFPEMQASECSISEFRWR